MGQFSDSIDRWVEQTKTRADLACRMIALELHKRIVLRSPVGNPELWAANADAQYRRETYNIFADAINSAISSDPNNFTSSGNLRRGVKRARRKSVKALAKEFPFKSGKGYVGGRFRGNWQVSISVPATTQLDRIDPSGAETMIAAAAALSTFKAGPSIYLMNNLPYSMRLEYEGWSKQAPSGMVRITVVEFDEIVTQIASQVAQS